MKILSITGGAGSMYCGSCLRDNALAAELMAQGHDVVLMPVYTPTLTDEPNVSSQKVLFGGISVYLQQHYAFFRNLPAWLDRIWDSRFALKLASRRSIAVDPKLLGEITVSMLEGEGGPLKKEFDKLSDWLATETPPDVVNLPYALLIALAGPMRRALGKPICCGLQGEDLFFEGLIEPYRSRSLELLRRHLDDVDVFLATSEYYAAFMREYLHLPAGKIEVLPISINFRDFERQRTPEPGVFRIGYLARIAPEKGLHNLAAAYRRLREKQGLPRLRLEAAGYLAPEHKGYLNTIERELAGTDFTYHGTLDRDSKVRFLQSIDVLSVPSDYAEPKGIYLLEAMASGVPVVQPHKGAFPEIIEKTGGGLLVRPDDPGALADGLATLARDRDLAEDLGRRGSSGVREHYSVPKAARQAVEIYSRAGMRPAFAG